MEEDDDFLKQLCEGGSDEIKDKYANDVEEFSTGMSEGIVRERSCTDVLCLVIFWAYIGGMIYMALYGYENGAYDKLMAPIDADNNFCGYGPNSGFPHMMLTDFTNPLNILRSGVCVDKCP